MTNDSDNECDLDILNSLLENEDQEPEEDTIQNTSKTLTLVDDFDFTSLESNSKTQSKSSTLLKNDKKDTPFSDEEDIDYFDRNQYSKFGQDVKELLKTKEDEKRDSLPLVSTPKSLSTLSTNIMKKNVNSPTPAKLTQPKSKLHCDPIFGYAINTPLISSAELVQLMEGRKAVQIADLKTFFQSGKPSEDWVVAGVLTHKTSGKKTAKGDSFAIWKLSDMSMQMNSVTLFVFRNAYKSLWKMKEGSVIGVLNANIMDSRDKQDLVPICVDNPARVMLMGTSRDMGICKSKKKNGEDCTAIVNTRLCEFCVYHVKQEYSKHSKRLDLQSSFSGKGINMNGSKKNPFQQSPASKMNNPESNFFRTVPAKKSAALVARDRDRLQKLKLDAPGSLIEEKVEIKPDLTDKKDYSRFETKIKSLLDKTPRELMQEKKPEIQLAPSKVMSLPKKEQFALAAPRTAARFENYQSNLTKNTLETTKSQLMAPKFDLNSLGRKVPKLGAGAVNGTIDLDFLPSRRTDKAKQNALQWIRENGAIKASNPNHILASKEAKARSSSKRKRVEEEEVVKADKNSLAEKFRKVMETKSAHEDLVMKAENEEEDKYFNKMETKERMEQKMLTTFQAPCKAVQCTVCKYIAFSASDSCKEERHRLKVMDAVKRFYKCGDCGNRTVTLERIPTITCSKCGSSNWVKSAMMDEKKTQIKTAHLSIRGDEEKFYGNIDNANINLIVPD